MKISSGVARWIEFWLTATNNEAPDPDSWSYTDVDIADNSAWTMNGNGHRFEVTVQATDRSGNQEQVVAANTVTFYFDNTVATSAVTQPISDASYNNLTQITGNASDDASGINPAGVDRVEVRIINKNGQFWNEAGGASFWGGSEVWNTASDTTTWTLDVTAAIAWNGLSGSSFTVNSRAYDNVDYSENVEVNYSTAVFWIDVESPTSTVTQPQYADYTGTSYYSNLLNITGNSSDDIGVDNVQVLIKKEDSNYWWDGSTWSASSNNWQDVTTDNMPWGDLSEAWTYSFASTSAWTSGERYRVNSRAKDTCDYNPNYETAYSTKVFKFDNVEPITQITLPVEDTGYKPDDITLIQGTSDDISGTYPARVNNVQISLRNMPLYKGVSGNGKWWDGGSSTDSFSIASEASSWINVSNLYLDDSWDTAISTAIWTDGKWYELKVRAIDNVPLTESSFDISRNNVRFSMDTASPESCLVTPPADVQTEYNKSSNQLTKIEGTADDATSGIDNVKINIIDNTGSVQYFTTSGGWIGLYSPATCDHLVNGTTEWYYDSSVGNFPVWESNEYIVRVWATDKTGNVESKSRNLGQQEGVFIVDADEPNTSVTSPIGPQNFVNNISGNCTDSAGTVNSGIDNVWIKIWDTSDNEYYNGGSWQVAEIWLDKASGVSITTPTWSYSIDDSKWDSGHQYQIISKSLDKAGNYETSYATETFIYDKAEPDSDTTTPENGVYYKSLTLLEGTAEDKPSLDRNSMVNKGSGF
jgi:hypothetical protein